MKLIVDLNRRFLGMLKFEGALKLEAIGEFIMI